MSRRYLPQELRHKATLHWSDAETADMLRQAADDADRAEKYRDALNDIQARVASGYFVDANHLAEIARNALAKPAE